MARKSPKCPPIVEPNQLGCVWNFSAMFDHHHHGGSRPNRKLLSDVSHGSKILTGTGHVKSHEIMVNFDEQLRGINIESKRKNAMPCSGERSVNKFLDTDTSLSKHMKKNKEVKRDSSQKLTDINAYDEGFCSQIPRKVEKDSRSGKTPKKYEKSDEKNTSFLDEKPGYSMEIWKKNGSERSFWEEIKSRTEQTNKKKKNPFFTERIVVLKPGQHPVVNPVDVGCGCSYLQPHHWSTSKQQIVKHARFSFRDIAKKLKNSRKVKNAKDSCDDVGKSGSQTSSLSIVPYAKQEANVFVEAKRHLAERLRQVAKGEASSSKQASRTLERILLSSPKHETVAALTTKREETHTRFSAWKGSEGGGGQSLQTRDKNSPSDSNPAQQNGCSEIMDTNGLKFSEGSRLDFSLDVSSPKSVGICKLETMDNDQFRGENPSPVSVLESFFVDNGSSPTSTVDSVEHHMQPQRLDFEEQSQTSSPPYRKTRLNSSMEDKGFISAYVKKVNQASQLNWDEFLTMECPEESSCDHKLLYDCIKEVLISTHQCYFEFFPFEKSTIRPFPLEEHVVNEVTEIVNWHTRPPTIPRTLDQLVRKDIAKSGNWVDVKLNSKEIVFEIVDEILQGLIMEVIFDFQS